MDLRGESEPLEGSEGVSAPQMSCFGMPSPEPTRSGRHRRPVDARCCGTAVMLGTCLPMSTQHILAAQQRDLPVRIDHQRGQRPDHACGLGALVTLLYEWQDSDNIFSAINLGYRPSALTLAGMD